MEADQFAPGRLHLLTGHDYTRCFVNHATHVATRPLASWSMLPAGISSGWLSSLLVGLWRRISAVDPEK